MEEINNLPSDCKKGTELEMVLMELKALTIKFNKKEKKDRSDTLEGINRDLQKVRKLMIPKMQNFSETKLKQLRMSILLKNVQNAKTVQS